MIRKPKHIKVVNSAMVNDSISKLRPLMSDEECKNAYRIAFEKYGSLIHKPETLKLFKG